MRISDWSSDVCSSDLPRRVAPEYLVQLQLEAHRQTVGQNPFDQLCRCQLSLTRREQHGTAVVEAVFDDAFACPVVIGTITNHELDFVVRQIGRASCRLRVCLYVSVLLVAVSFIKNNKIIQSLYPFSTKKT